MDQKQYNTGWQLAQWATLGVAVCSLLGVFVDFFGVLSSLSIGVIGVGYFLSANELVKASHPAAELLKKGAIFLFIITGLNVLSSIIVATNNVHSVSGAFFAVAMAGLFVIGVGVLMLMFKKNMSAAFEKLNLNQGLFSAGILVYAIGSFVLGFGLFIFGIAPSLGTLGMMGVLSVLGGLGMFVGAVLWIIGQFSITAQAIKQ